MSMRFFLMPAALVLLAACNNPSDPVPPSDPAMPPHPVPETSVPALVPKAQAAPLVGADSDVHGCKTSAGYTWSPLQEKCLRLFESGKRLDAMAQGARAEGLAAYVVFDKTGARAEVFLPGEKSPLLLEPSGIEGEQVWAAGDYRLIPWKGYVLKKNGQAIYAGE